jgi:hypothetical protein
LGLRLGASRDGDLHRGFGDLERPSGLAEIALRRGLDTVGTGAEINPVEVELENLGLAQLALEPKRKHEFLHLAPERALLRQEQVLGELLGDGRSALGDVPAGEIGEHRAREAHGIDTEMAVEAAVLDGDEGL